MRQATVCRTSRPVRRTRCVALAVALWWQQATRTATMANPPRKIGFVLAATEHGTMILNRFDYHHNANGSYGVGQQLLDNAVYDPFEIGNAVRLLAARRTYFGDGVMAIDCGANIGVHTLE